MPEKSGKAHIEADFISCVCLGVDVFKIIFTAIMLLLLLFLNSHNDFDGVQEAEVTGACGVQLRRGEEQYSPLPPLQLQPIGCCYVSATCSPIKARVVQMTPDWGSSNFRLMTRVPDLIFVYHNPSKCLLRLKHWTIYIIIY